MNLKDLSLLLNLSQTTVSRALNGYSDVSDATRKKVKAAADAHNYHPNIRARSLATGRAMAIGHVIPFSSKIEMVNPIFGDFIAGANEVYSKSGFDMMISIVAEEDQEETYRSLHRKGSVDGIIVHAPRMGDDRIGLLNEIGIPFVVHGRASDCTEPYSWVDVNNMHAFTRATDLLLDLGHHQIALINGREDMDFALRRRAGYQEAHTKRTLTVDPNFMHSGDMTEASGYETAVRMLTQENAPTAFVVASIISAIGVRRAIENSGLKMGRDISVVTHDDVLGYFANGGKIPLFTATRSSVREAGRLSGEMLINKINSAQSGASNLLLEAELVLGASTGPVKNEI